MKFILGIHNHQPVGNFDYVFEDSYQKSYKPFLDMAERYPTINFTLHVSGPLIEWLEANHSDYLDRVANLVMDDRCEIISSGFYEPILISISDKDKIGHIQMMNDYIKNRFGKAPEGLWLTERVWEPGLVKPIVKAGIKYIAVDDQHFSTANAQLDKLCGYYLTEDQGYVLGVFPISQKLRYAIPFEEPEVTIDLLKQNDRDEKSVMVMADDGEKFGVWPGSHDRCFKKENWLQRFLDKLVDNADWLDTVTFSDYFNHYKPTGRVYLPTSSYFEMSEWTLPISHGKKYSQYVDHLKTDNTFDQIRPYLRGGTWRDFLTKYDESNWMMKRANYVSNLLNGQENEQAQKAVWRSQCNCAFWHGVFGGLYLPHLRHAIYANIIEAEELISKDSPRLVDIDKDGTKEIIVSSGDLRVILTPNSGAIREIDVISRRFNLVNTFSRHEESYHHKLFNLHTNEDGKTSSIHDLVMTKEDGLEKLLHYDSHPRWFLMDHFYNTEVTIEEISNSTCREYGDFLLQDFDMADQGDRITFTRSGMVDGIPVKLVKILSFTGSKISFSIEITNKGKTELNFLYANEMNLSMLGGHVDDRYYLIDGKKLKDPYLDSMGTETAKNIAVRTDWENIECRLDFTNETEIRRYPVMTVSMSEAGFEKIYQSSVILPGWNLQLKPGNRELIQFDLNIITRGEKND